jgi:hypothetical protein
MALNVLKVVWIHLENGEDLSLDFKSCLFQLLELE